MTADRAARNHAAPNHAVMPQIIRAQITLSEALEIWNGADLASIGNANALLETSVRHLQEFHDAVSLGKVVPTAQMRSAVSGMCDQIQRLTRVVDASSAFVQGLAVYAGVRATTYNASGQIQDAPIPSTLES